MPPFQLVGERETGEFGLSIPTDLAVAGSVGRHPDRPLTYRPIDRYQEVWINLATLVRNAYGSFTTDEQKRLDSQHLIDAVEQDMMALPELYQQILPPEHPIRVRFYHNNYQNIGKILKRARPRTMKTTLQQQTFHLQQDAIQTLIKMYLETGTPIDEYDFYLKGNHPKVALLTHQPVDLLSRRFFQDLALLESHTGTLKTREAWYTKYGREDALKRLPFDQALIQIFGDGNNLLSMYPAKIRRKLLEIAQKRRWTYMTTKDKVLSNVRSEKEIELYLLMVDAYK